MTTKLYIANLGKYNEGSLVGNWLTLPVSEEELQEFLKEEVEIDERYEEYAVHDYETDLGIHIGEYENISELSDLVEAYDNLKEYEKHIVEAINDWSYYGSTNEALKEAIENVESFNLMTDVNSDSDYGYYIVDEGLFGVEIPDSLTNYIDYEALGRDWSMNGDCYYSIHGLIEYVG
jgi:antirestriction protein